MRLSIALAVPLLTVLTQNGAETYDAARLVGDGVPPLPVLATSGGEVLLEVTVGANGTVRQVDRLRITPPYTDFVVGAVQAWRFAPAIRTLKGVREPTESKVLVAAIFRPPALYLGTTIGEPPRPVAAPSPVIPFPRDLILPPYPPNARGDGVVLLEVDVLADGMIRNLRVLGSAGGFDEPAADAVRKWSFDPARLPEGAIRSFAYVIVGFREPVVIRPR